MAIAGIKFDLYILNAGSFILLADLRHTFSIVPDRIVSTGDEKQWEIFRNLLNMSRILYVLDAAEHLVIAVDCETEGGPWMMNAGVDDSLISGWEPVPMMIAPDRPSACIWMYCRVRKDPMLCPRKK